MSVISIDALESFIYVILGIDENAHDQVLCVCKTYEDAKKYCVEYLMETPYYDVWIEKHVLT